jgi:RNA polymerase sigma-70 factor, ECF subfamily
MAVARAKTGDRAALEYLYIRYSNNVYGYVRSIVRNDHDAEDVTQHVFAKLMTSLCKYDDRGVPFFAWLLRMSRNVAIDHLRANRVTPSDTLEDRDAASTDDVDQSLTVRDAFSALPADQREVIVLRHVLGFSPGEIATKLGRSEASIHGLHHRGRRTLTQALSSVGAGPATMRASARGR